MKDPKELKIDWSDPGPGIIAAFGFAIISDLILIPGLFLLALIPIGTVIGLFTVLAHYIACVVVAAVMWPKLRSPKSSLNENTGPKASRPGNTAKEDAGLNKAIDGAINTIINPKIVLVISMVFPLPLITIGMIVAIILQNAIVKLLIDIAVKLVVVGAVTGGVGDIAEGAAAVGEVGEAVAGTAEAAEGVAEGAGATGEVAEAASTATEGVEAAAEAEEGIGEAGDQTFRSRYRREVGKALRQRTGQTTREDEGDSEEEPELSPEDQELEDILNGDYVGRSIRENLGLQGVMNEIGTQEVLGGKLKSKENEGKFNQEVMTPKPMPMPVTPQQNNKGYNNVVDLRETPDKKT